MHKNRTKISDSYIDLTIGLDITKLIPYLFKHWVFLLQHKEFGRFLFHLSLQLDHVNILLNICPV